MQSEGNSSTLAISKLNAQFRCLIMAMSVILAESRIEIVFVL